jgi:hypothetical protein
VVGSLWDLYELWASALGVCKRVRSLQGHRPKRKPCLQKYAERSFRLDRDTNQLQIRLRQSYLRKLRKRISFRYPVSMKN